MAWFDELPDSLTTANSDGTTMPLREHPFIRESPEVGHFVNKAFQQHREFGSRLPIRKPETPEAAEQWRKDNLPKLYDAGLLERPPSKPEEYEIRKPAELPKGQVWSDEHALKLGGLLHKYNIPKRAASEFLELHNEVIGLNQQSLSTDMESAMRALRAEHGDKFEERAAQAQRLVKEVFKDPAEIEFFSESGIGNHPKFLSVMMRLAPLAAQDSSVITDANRQDGRPTGEEVRAELADIMGNPQNPKHKLYQMKDPATLAYIDGRYRAAYGDGKVTIS